MIIALSPITCMLCHLASTAFVNRRCSPTNSATLLVIDGCPNAVTAAHSTLSRSGLTPNSTMSLPPPPGPGFPLDMP
ncbi:hypothetical protein PF005_g1327 [Phytophthora fragariae]|uniref:Secreted protein n=1 Tax=Phytophthora fragariae TaxID=53985 RepID=A0A6A3UWD7_9STRA|nr:hypothetical protein PF003_g25973 [Phytophthora fragariae]KAE8949099.1 hypothetical protein PF009_g1354 [Phytophthora fragariae]KAE9015460.1 hypothetical protein PF011_g7591 [Phytophthora fragariae]KAE9138105.1 hypothetical protein PF010_g1058 [Phytophthora fragariae]KAE9138804.1 hypothetical protein PF007_g1256 [Phytophthora fragariae]